MTLAESLTTVTVRRMAMTTIALVSMVVLGVRSASAGAIITAGNVPGADNVLFNVVGLQNDALVVEGIVQNSVFSLAEFEGIETLHSNGGQARITGFEGAGYDSLLVRVPGNTFDKLLVNLNTLTGAAGSVSFFLDGVDYGTAFAIGNGSNFFTIEGQNGTTFSTVRFVTTIDLEDTRQIRIGGIAPVIPPTTTTGTPVPEPSTWAMALVGLAALGLRARTRRA